MKAWIILAGIVFQMTGAEAQTNLPAPVNLRLSPLPEIRPVSASLKTEPPSTATQPSMTKVPGLTPHESEITRSRSGTEYRGILARSPLPAGGKFNPLQLINPFAPMSYGIAGSSPAATPRTFRSEKTHEPVGLTIISVNR